MLFQLDGTSPDIAAVRRILFNLAVAVVSRAVHDLTATHEENTDAIRHEAYMFLTEYLWRPSCVWSQILDGSINKESVLRKVHERCRLTPDNKIEVLTWTE